MPARSRRRRACGAPRRRCRHRGCSSTASVVAARRLGRARLEQRATHRARAAEQTLRRRHAEQAGDLAAATGLAEDRHVRRVAAELRDVVAHPLERGDDVEHADVARVGELVAEMRHVEEPEDAEPMVDTDDDHVVVARQVREVVQRPRRRPDRHAAAVQPHEHRTRRAVTDPRRPHVQHEAVLARPALVVPHTHEGLDLGRQLLAGHLARP